MPHKATAPNDARQQVLFSGLSALQILRETCPLSSCLFRSPAISHVALPTNSTSQNRTVELTQAISFISAGCNGWKRGLSVAVEAHAGAQYSIPGIVADDVKGKAALKQKLQEAINTEDVRDRVETEIFKKPKTDEDDSCEDISAEDTAIILDSLLSAHPTPSFTDTSFFSPSPTSSGETSPSSTESSVPPRVVIKDDHAEYRRNPADTYPSPLLPTFTIRVAMDNDYPSEEDGVISKLQSILASVMNFIGGSEGDKWRDIVRTTHNRPAALGFQAMLIRDFANGALLSRIIACHEPHLSKMVASYARYAIRAWEVMKDPLLGVERRREEMLLQRMFQGDEEKEEVEQLEMSPVRERSDPIREQVNNKANTEKEPSSQVSSNPLPLPQSTDFPPLSATTPSHVSSAPDIPPAADDQKQTKEDHGSDAKSFDSVETPPNETLSSVIDELVDDLNVLVRDADNANLDSHDPNKVAPLSADARHERLLLCIWASILSLRHREGGIDDLEDVWKQLTQKYPGVYEPSEPEAGADDPSSILDYQYLASDAAPACPLVRIMLRLARYLTAGIAVTKYLLQASVALEHFNIRIRSVTGGEGVFRSKDLGYGSNARESWVGMLTAARIIEPVDHAIMKEDGTANVHRGGECTQRNDAGTFPTDMLSVLENRWCSMLKEGNMYLHAPVKLAMFYATNPFVLPISGVMGVTRSLCIGCEAFLQLAQLTDGLFNTAQTGPPIELSHVLTVALPDPTFLFPNLNTFLDTRHHLPPLEKERLQTRLDLISRRMTDEIRRGVGETLIKLYAPAPHVAAPGDSPAAEPLEQTKLQKEESSPPDANAPFVSAGDDGTSVEQTLDEEINVPPVDETEPSVTVLGRADENVSPLASGEHDVKDEGEGASLKHKKGPSEPKKLRERLKRWGLWKNVKNERHHD